MLQVVMLTPRCFPFCQWLLVAVFAGLALSCQTFRDRTSLSQAANERLFREGVATILEYRCLGCHNAVDAPRHGGLNLESREVAFSSGKHAPVIRPGRPAESLLYRVLEASESHAVFMPPKPDRLWENEKKVLWNWIAGRAHWPAGKDGALTRPQDWPNAS